MRDHKAWTIAYAAILSFVCAACLTVVYGFAKPAYEANRRQEQLSLALLALGVEVPEGGDVEAIHAKRVQEVVEGDLTYLQSRTAEGGAIQALAFDVDGKGLWSTIKAFVAMEPDLKTVRSVIFYEQEETPGLGAEIALPPFQGQFPGKRLLGDDGALLIRVVKPGNAKGEEIDGISGATVTGEGVNQIMGKVADIVRRLRAAREEQAEG